MVGCLPQALKTGVNEQLQSGSYGQTYLINLLTLAHYTEKALQRRGRKCLVIPTGKTNKQKQ